ncbi:type 1 fimbrial protein [Kosakonia sacchari]|uniref:fimbrial protein n=1 Tax=Kosakonia sacchari TaxID=1158459 RepID=UPI002ACED7FD|nr:fimbrial protein [Kosakonia sacchari]MDZ7320052.1 type 1 fimbrial protein [Kosakonia sacchari]
MNFSGTLRAQPCTIVTDTQDQTIRFSELIRSAFIKNHRSPPRKFEIRLEECDLTDGNLVKVLFYGEADKNQPDAFTVNGQVEGVAIVIEDQKGNLIPPDSSSAGQQLTGAQNTLDYTAYVQAPNYEKIRVGDFEAIVTFSLEYE